MSLVLSELKPVFDHLPFKNSCVQALLGNRQMVDFSPREVYTSTANKGESLVITVTLREARRQLGKLVDAAARGEEIVITRRGRKAAKLSRATEAPLAPLPDLGEFRASLRVSGSLTSCLLEMRDEERA